MLIRLPSTRSPSRSAPRYAVPQLEELESRALMSASGWEAQPLTDMTPLAAASTLTVYSPAQIRSIYGFDKLPYAGLGQSIAIVGAFDNPTVYSDLQVFDRAFGLPDPTAYAKLMPFGQPAANASWAGETALDVEWAHAIAPRANIFLVEARSSSSTDLLAAVDYARRIPGVTVVSMSWGGPEFYGQSAYDSIFTTPAGHIGGGMGKLGGVTFVASSGDSGSGGGVEWPSVSPNVLAVGGTSLHAAGGTYQSETAWVGSGGGYSKYTTEPAFQRLVQSQGVRSLPDVGYDADPTTGVYVFMSYGLTAGQSGWFSFGGTSAGAPQWAGLIALANEGRAQYGLASMANAQATLYSLPATDFHDVVGGSNGYAATAGYDLDTGRGSPVAYLVIQHLITYGSATASPSAAVKPVAVATTTVKKASVTDVGFFASDILTLTGTDAFRPLVVDTAPRPESPNDAVWTAPLRTEMDDHLRDLVRGFMPAHLGGHDHLDAETLADLVFFDENFGERPA